MGWWGSGILEGDTPLDYLADIERILDVKELYPLFGWDDVKREEVLAAVFKFNDFSLGKICGDKRHEHEVFIQVLACVIMASGAPMSKVFREAAIKAGNEDPWMREEGTNSPRGTSIKNFQDAVQKYKDGEPFVITSKGLFQRIDEEMGGGDNPSCRHLKNPEICAVPCKRCGHKCCDHDGWDPYSCEIKGCNCGGYDDPEEDV